MSEKAERDEASEPDLNVFAVDSFSQGIAWGQHRIPSGEDPRQHLTLALPDEQRSLRLRSRYVLRHDDPLGSLERNLFRLSSQGTLRRASIYFGVTTDPFHPFEGKFDASMKFLNLFLKFTPGHLTVQTRSPLLVIAMPVLQRLGRGCSVVIPIETPDDRVASRLTPSLPRVEERFECVRALRALGVEVHIQVAPLLPYGDWRADADAFAKLLVEHADFIHVMGMAQGGRSTKSPLAQQLAAERRFHWLRHDAEQPLLTALAERAPEKLLRPPRPHLLDRQMRIFAA